jgi:hypothetical protein
MVSTQVGGSLVGRGKNVVNLYFCDSKNIHVYIKAYSNIFLG